MESLFRAKAVCVVGKKKRAEEDTVELILQGAKGNEGRDVSLRNSRFSLYRAKRVWHLQSLAYGAFLLHFRFGK